MSPFYPLFLPSRVIFAGKPCILKLAFNDMVQVGPNGSAVVLVKKKRKLLATSRRRTIPAAVIHAAEYPFISPISSAVAVRPQDPVRGSGSLQQSVAASSGRRGRRQRPAPAKSRPYNGPPLAVSHSYGSS